jgi:hypothetical protein
MPDVINGWHGALQPRGRLLENNDLAAKNVLVKLHELQALFLQEAENTRLGGTTRSSSARGAASERHRRARRLHLLGQVVRAAAHVLAQHHRALHTLTADVASRRAAARA